MLRNPIPCLVLGNFFISGKKICLGIWKGKKIKNLATLENRKEKKTMLFGDFGYGQSTYSVLK